MIGVALHDSKRGGPAEGDALKELNRFLGLVGAQDDRAMVLSLAAFIEDTLGRLLLAYFRSCKATRELVDGFSAPLGTLGARIKAAYAFGLTTDEQYKDMEILRKVRNQVAHNWEGISLDHHRIQSLVGQLSCYTFDHLPIEGGARERLLRTLSTCCIELQVFLGRVESGKADKAPDVSHRLTTVMPTEPSRPRFVK